MKRVQNVECIACGFLLPTQCFSQYESLGHGRFRRGICRDCEASGFGKGRVAETLPDPPAFVVEPVSRPPKMPEPVQLSFI